MSNEDIKKIAARLKRGNASFSTENLNNLAKLAKPGQQVHGSVNGLSSFKPASRLKAPTGPQPAKKDPKK